MRQISVSTLIEYIIPKRTGSEIDKAVQDKNDELLKEIWSDLFTLRDFVWYKAQEQLKD